MGVSPSRVAVIVCPLCSRRHALRVNEGRIPVECGGLAEAFDGEHFTEARVWPAGRPDLPGRRAGIASVSEV